jgi:hypothetical protein
MFEKSVYEGSQYIIVSKPLRKDRSLRNTRIGHSMYIIFFSGTVINLNPVTAALCSLCESDTKSRTQKQKGIRPNSVLKRFFFVELCANQLLHIH